MKYFKPIYIAILLTMIHGVSYAQSNYKVAASQLYRSIQDNFYINDSGYYREEAKGTKTEKPVSFLWGLCAMVQASNEMDAALHTKNYLPAILNVIDKYKDTRPATVGYASYKEGDKCDDRFYDDNQWIGIASLDAYRRTNDKKYLNLGSTIYRFMMSGYDTVTGGGIYWVESNKESKNTCSNGPGILVALGMYASTKNKAYLDTAKLLYSWTNEHLRNTDGLYFDNYNIKKHKVDSALYSYNAGTMLESAVWLYTITKDKTYLNEANITAKNAANHFLGKGAFIDDYWFNAVMLRGYLRLYQLDNNPQYIRQFENCIHYTLQNEKFKNGLFGQKKVDNLVGQAGLLEMLLRLSQF